MRTIDAGTGACALADDERGGGAGRRLGVAAGATAVRGEVAAYWRMTALVHSLTRIADPGTGLRLQLPTRLLDEEFGVGGIMRFEDVDFPATLTHEPTRRFLRETGLPEDGVTFQLEMDVPLQTLAERYAAEEVPAPHLGGQLPDAAERLIRLGRLGRLGCFGSPDRLVVEDTDLLVDGTTGELHEWSASDTGLRPLNADISTLAFTLWLLRRAETQQGL
ncbi:SUKH-4 family immunity protein [Streptomyces sp. CA-288835]|uniref:SUKH-4 family immunity protein n=1 Tax=Streptomyces sp. CA-288835 TaxID=3240069 RepID=UPI003D938105